MNTDHLPPEIKQIIKEYSNKMTPELYLTDLGNAERMVLMFGNDIFYSYELKRWIVWGGNRWEVDTSGEVHRKAKQTIRSFYSEAADTEDDKKREALIKHARRSESDNKIKAMLSLAQSESEIPIKITEFDKDPWLLNVKNGTIDLKSGEIKQHCKKDMISKIAPVEYDPNARSDVFEKFLQQIIPDRDTRYYTQKAFGYSITGDVSEEKLFFVYGPPATGKSTLINAIKNVLAEYSVTTDFETFLARERVTGAPRADIARLAGRRFVVSIEVDEGKKLAEGLVNMLTGGDTVTARHLYKDSFEFQPEFKLWLCANNRPRITGSDGAIWRRIVMIPFLEEVSPENRDLTLKKKLKDAAPAILKWLIDGCLLWQKEGLDTPPEAIKKTTSDYRQENDPLKDFLEDCCNISSSAWVNNTVLFAEYERWCRGNGERYPLGRKKFTQEFNNKGFDQISDGKARKWIGLDLKNNH